MAYAHTNSNGKTYYLHARTITRKSGAVTTLYYFSARPPGDPSTDAPPPDTNVVDEIPAGYKVIEMKSGLPALKKL